MQRKNTGMHVYLEYGGFMVGLEETMLVCERMKDVSPFYSQLLSTVLCSRLKPPSSKKKLAHL